jgi:hypothetical protein
MNAKQITIGGEYLVKVAGILTVVRIERAHEHGGWIARNVATGREVRIRTARRLRYKFDDCDDCRQYRQRVLERAHRALAVEREIHRAYRAQDVQRILRLVPNQEVQHDD